MPIRAGPFLFSSHLSQFEVLLLFCYRSITTPVTTPLYANRILKKPGWQRPSIFMFIATHLTHADMGGTQTKFLIGG